MTFSALGFEGAGSFTWRSKTGTGSSVKSRESAYGSHAPPMARRTAIARSAMNFDRLTRPVVSDDGDLAEMGGAFERFERAPSVFECERSIDHRFEFCRLDGAIHGLEIAT